MSCPAYITSLSQQIWNDLGQPADQPIAYIQSKLISPSYVGQLTNAISDCFIASGGMIEPELTEAQQGIYRLMYEKDFYTTKMNQALAGLAPGGGALELRDGDSVVRLTNPVEIARMYKEMQKQLNEQWQFAVASYKNNQALPRDVVYPMIFNVVGGGNWAYPSNIPAAGGPHTYYRS